MGAPSVVVEKLIAGDELQLAAKKMQELVLCDVKDMEIFTSERGVKYVTRLPQLDNNMVIF